MSTGQSTPLVFQPRSFQQVRRRIGYTVLYAILAIFSLFMWMRQNSDEGLTWSAAIW